MATHSRILAWRTPGQRSLVGYSSWGGKELDTTEQFSPPFQIRQKKTQRHHVM